MINYYKLKYFITKKNIKIVISLLPLVEKFDYELLKLLIKLNEISIINKLFTVFDFTELRNEELRWLVTFVIKTKNISIINKFYDLIISVMELNIIHNIIGTRDYTIFTRFPLHYFLESRTLDLATSCYNEDVFDKLLNNINKECITSNTLINVIFKNDIKLFEKVLNKCDSTIISSSVFYYSCKNEEMFNILVKTVNYNEFINDNIIRVASEYYNTLPYVSKYIPIDKENKFYLLNNKDYDKLINKFQENYNINEIISLLNHQFSDYELFCEKLIDNIDFPINDLQRFANCIIWAGNFNLFNKIKDKILITTDILDTTIITKNIKIFDSIFNENIIQESTRYYAVCSSNKYIINKVFLIPTFIEWQTTNHILLTKKVYLLEKMISYIYINNEVTGIAFDTLNKKIINIILSQSTYYITPQMICKLLYHTNDVKFIRFIYNKYNLNVYNDELIILLLIKNCFDILNKIFNKNDININLLNYCIKFFPYTEIIRNSKWMKKVNNKKVTNLLLHQNKAIKTIINDNYLMREIIYYL